MVCMIVFQVSLRALGKFISTQTGNKNVNQIVWKYFCKRRSRANAVVII
jgi:hypothetical protein